MTAHASPVERPLRNADATKARLLAAAEAEFAAKGFDGARLGNIARAAGVQQALIHHYFADKEGIYREVLARGIAALTLESWDILGRPDGAKGGPKRGVSSAKGGTLEALATAFVDAFVRFYATHGALLAIVRHDAAGSDSAVAEVLESHSRPVFEAVARRIDALKAKGEVRKDVHAKQLCVSVIAMASFPFQEERFLSSLWPVDWHDPKVLERYKREIVVTVLARAAA